MPKHRLALAAIALLVSATPAMAQYFSAPPGACGYYINSRGHAVPRPCGDARNQPPPPGSTARCADNTYSTVNIPMHRGPARTTAV
jgi:hypothetical protein